ncbi:hypothetical protein EB796_012692 [Bugula neritina]|uniref:Uncharacterized protein n=1 Tax=Bugula neritina TaxID=10212 RepID=A0A7J7JSX3_BUGNE|nr:hypothetical protein EB796_012692 [Bugula neritina]
MKESGTDVRIIPTKTDNLAKVMTGIYDVLNRSESPYREVKKDFSVKDPFVSFAVEKVSGTFHLRFSEEGNQNANMILAVYSKCHRKLKQLGVLFKHMAKIGHMADAEKGSLAPYCYPILAVFYCQQARLVPVLLQNTKLEVLAESELQGEIDNIKPSAMETQLGDKSIGQLWLDMLQFFSIKFKPETHVVSILSYKLQSKQARAWGTRKLAVEDSGNTP